MYIYTEADDLTMRIESAIHQALKKSEPWDVWAERAGYDPVTHTTAEQRAAADEDGICMNVLGEYVCIKRRIKYGTIQ